MTRILLVLEIALIGIGVPLAGLAYWQARYALANLGFLILGAGALLGGVETMITRRIRMRGRPGYTAFYRGVAAFGIGLTFVAIGGALALFGWLGSAGREERFLDLVFQRPSAALLPAGALLFGTGLMTVGGENRGKVTGIERVIAIGDKAPGILLLLMSVVVLGVGLVELLMPATFDDVVRQVTGLSP